MAVLGPGEAIEAPPALAPLHNLIDTAAAVSPTLEVEKKWELGFSYRPTSCGCAQAWSWECGEEKAEKDPPSPTALVEYEPFIIHAANPDCQHVDDPSGEAEALLELTKSRAVEHELWTGTMGPGNLHLASVGATQLNGGAATGPRAALAALTQAIASCGGGNRGMIHAPAYAVELWSDWLVEDGDVLRTKVRGDIVIPGAGYPGTSPAGAAPADGTTWAYATGMVSVLLGEVEIVPDEDGQALDRRTNSLIYRAERSAAATWDGCCHYGVLVNLG